MEKIIAYTDGVARGNPGPAAAGVYITNQKSEVLKEVTKSLGNANSTFAEYYGVMLVLQTLLQIYDEKTLELQFEIRLTSDVVYKQLTDQSPIHQPGLVPMFIEIHNLRIASFPNLAFRHVTHEQNSVVERLVKEVLDVG